MDRIKVFLVEDEVVIRNAIKNRIDWEKEGFEFVGEAGDGELAFPKIKESEPDIVITDIKMPFVDGLELSRLIKKEMPKTYIILLTGYDEFEYAREAIRIGISEYLLKPVSSEKLVETLKKVSEDIKKDREELLLIEQYEKDMRENSDREKMEFLNRILAFDISVTEVVSIGENLGMDFTRGCYNVMLFNTFCDMDSTGNIKSINTINEKIEEKYINSEYVYLFQRELGGWVFIVSAHDDDELAKITDKLVEDIKSIMEGNRDIKYFGGVGTPVHRVHHISRAFNSAEEAFAVRFSSEKSEIVFKGKAQDDLPEDLKEFVFGDFGKTGEMISRFIKSGEAEELDGFIDTLKETMDGEHFDSTMVKNYVLMDVYVRCMSECEVLNNDENKDTQKDKDQTGYKSIADYKDRFTEIKSRDEIFEFIKDIVRDTVNFRDGIKALQFSTLIKRTKELIKEGYADKEFGLRSVADKLGANKSYLSRLFLQECGVSFTDYLVEYRLKKGEELLDNTDMTVTAISLEVGYSDPHYFSYVYKKVRGFTPREYRIRKRD